MVGGMDGKKRVMIKHENNILGISDVKRDWVRTGGDVREPLARAGSVSSWFGPARNQYDGEIVDTEEVGRGGG